MKARSLAIAIAATACLPASAGWAQGGGGPPPVHLQTPPPPRTAIARIQREGGQQFVEDGQGFHRAFIDADCLALPVAATTTHATDFAARQATIRACRDTVAHYRQQIDEHFALYRTRLAKAPGSGAERRRALADVSPQQQQMVDRLYDLLKEAVDQRGEIFALLSDHPDAWIDSPQGMQFTDMQLHDIFVQKVEAVRRTNHELQALDQQIEGPPPKG